MSNAGLIGFPAGTGVMDAASQAIFGSVVSGANLHRVNLPTSVDALRPGFMFQWVPTAPNTGPVDVVLNGEGPFPAMKPGVTRTADTPGAALLPLQPADVVPGRTLMGILRKSGRGSFVVELIAGVTPPFGENGIQLALSPNAASSRGILGLASGATTTVGTAATRNVGTASGQVPLVVDGAGNLDGGLNVVHKTLDNLVGAGVLRTLWSSITFSVGAGIIATFNGMSVATLGVGHYALTFPDASGTAYEVDINIDASLSTNGISHYVESGSRSATGCQIYTTRGNSSYSVFDPDRVSVAIFRIA